MGKVLIIDDEKQILSLLSRIIGLEGYEVFQATNCKVGIKQLEQNDPEVVLCDVCLPDGSGVELVSELKRLRPLSEVILLTAHGNIPDGVQAIKNGAFDYITKGDDNNKILPLIAKAMEKATVAYSQQKAVGKQYSFATVIGRSPAIEEAVSLARKVAATDVPVLLTGETGTGKEVFAQSIHQHSSRSDKAFVAINCSSFSLRPVGKRGCSGIRRELSPVHSKRRKDCLRKQTTARSFSTRSVRWRSIFRPSYSVFSKPVNSSRWRHETCQSECACDSRHQP